MANIDNSNNFFIKAPKFSWLKFSYSQEKLNDINFLKNQGVKSTIRNNKSETENNIESRSQSFIELTKLLTDNCQYGILDEYAGTKEERENEKKEKKLRIQKKQKEKKEEKEFEEKIKNGNYKKKSIYIMLKNVIMNIFIYYYDLIIFIINPFFFFFFFFFFFAISIDKI